MQEEVTFVSLRGDWYTSNSTMPRLVRACLAGKRDICFTGFPRQWLPIFEWYGIKWRGSSDPRHHVPIFSDLEERAIIQIIHRAKSKGTLRILVESASMCDPIVSDFLYIVDNTAPVSPNLLQRDMSEIRERNENSAKHRLILNGWQSYGRPSIRVLESKVSQIHSTLSSALVLPCALRRPYDVSRTHKRIYLELENRGYNISGYHKIVFTSLGVLPSEVWSEPEVLTYNAGVPDIYRTLRLARAFFSTRKYRCVLDCLQYEPYSDVLRILEREGLIARLERIKIGPTRHFYLKNE